MVAMREKWTDERLDDLTQRMADGFVLLRDEQRQLREEQRALRVEMDSRFNALESRIDQRFNSLLATILGGFALVILTHFA
jgi:chromosome segregation ATPase